LNEKDVKDRLEHRHQGHRGQQGSPAVSDRPRGNTQEWITKYTSKVIDKRGPREPRKAQMKKEDVFYWTSRPRPSRPKEFLGHNIRIVPAKSYSDLRRG